MINLSNIQKSRPLVFLLVILVSVFSSVYIYIKNTGTNSAAINQVKESLVQTKAESIKVELNYDLDSGFVDIYLSANNSKVSLMEFVFKTTGETKLHSLEKADLFNDYLKTASKDSFRVASTGGPEAREVTINDRVLFARLKMDGLKTNEDLTLDLQKSQAITKDDKLIKLVY
ncbi:hypothetical protein GW755_04285 [bacterium]|nr:hypothetical protein [bacterium]